MASAGVALGAEPPAPRVTLAWSAPPACPARAAVLEEITQTVGETTSARAPIQASAVVREDPEGLWQGDLELVALGQSTRRTVEGDSCRAVAEALALIVALAVNPDAEPAAPTPEAPPAPPLLRPSPADAAPSAEFPSRARPAKTSAGPFAVEASFVLDTGMLPATAYGAEIAIAWAPRALPRLSLAVVGAFVGTVDGTLQERPSQGGHFSLVHAGARACYALLRGVVELGPCGGVGGEWVFASGYGSDQPASATGGAFVLSFGGRLACNLSSRFALTGGAEGVVPLARPSFVIDNGGTVFETPRIALRAAAGAAVRF